MKVTFVYPDVEPQLPDWSGYYYQGIASLSAVLKQAGHQTSLVHLTHPLPENAFVSRIRREDPDLIGISTTSHMFPLVRQLVGWLRQANIRVPVVCGGIHPTIAPEETLQVPGIDILCRGEGEAPLTELCNHLEQGQDITPIANLWIKTPTTIVKNSLRPQLPNLDALPFPDRSIFSYRTLYRERHGTAVFMASRGCPFQCTYCSNHLLRQIYGKNSKAVRFHSVAHVIAEIQQVLATYPFITTILFEDDILFLTKPWAREFARRFPQEINLPLICQARADLTTPAMIALLKQAGCIHIKFGLESGNEVIRTQILHRHMTNAQIKQAFALCHQAGFITQSYNMVGIPFETPKTILDTIKLNADAGADIMQVAIYQPYQGTKLAELCRSRNLIISKDLNINMYSPSVLKSDSLTHSQIIMFRNYFKLFVHCYRLVKKLPQHLSQKLTDITDSLLANRSVSNLLNLLHRPVRGLYKPLSARINHKLLSPQPLELEH